MNELLKMKQVLIVEDHHLISMSLRIVLHQIDENINVSEIQNFEDAMQEIRVRHFDFIILDIYIPGGKGIQMLGLIRKELPKVAILICSSAEEDQNAERFIMAGANGFLSKSAAQDETRAAISTVMNGDRYVSAKIHSKLLSHGFSRKETAVRLSPRETEITKLLLEGKWTKEIAQTLNLSVSTVSTFKARIFEKMEVDSVVALFTKINADDLI